MMQVAHTALLGQPGVRLVRNRDVRERFVVAFTAVA